jgi:hypothetical protein
LSASGDLEGVGRHRRDRLAVVAHLAPGEHVLVDDVEPDADVELVAGHDGAHSGKGRRPRGLDAHDARPRVGALLDLRVQHARDDHVAHVAGVARELLARVRAARRATDVPEAGAPGARARHA